MTGNFQTIIETLLQINDNIRKHRELKGYSQQDVADLIGEKRSTYAYWERNVTPKGDVLSKIAKVLEVPIDVLLSGTDEDMTTITGKFPYQVRGADEKDKMIQQQQEQIIRLEAEVKSLKEMIDKLLQNR